MNKPENQKFIGGLDSIIPGALLFNHAAMNTTFEIFILHEDKNYAAQAAQAAFSQIDELESIFSRFIENSDISQIANLSAHETLCLSIDTFECLKLSQRVCEKTRGAFDISVGTLMNCWFDKDKNPRVPSQDELKIAKERTGCGIFKLNEEQFSIEPLKNNVQIDLGAVGKGYAVDKAGELLRDWDITKVLVNGGGSSVLALDAPDKMQGWPVTFSSPDDKVLKKINLKNLAVSGSGVQKGKHIINPHTGRPVEDKLGAWVCCSNAAQADALSTAFMVMDIDEIKKYSEKNSDVQVIILPAGAKEIISFGNWQNISMA